MPTPRLLLIGVPLFIVLTAAFYFVLHPELMRAPRVKVAAAAPVPVTNVPTENNGPGGHMRAIFAQLGLTDAQKMQIAQIRQTTTDRQQRRAAIMNVLTPDQRTKFQQLRAAQDAPPPSPPAP